MKIIITENKLERLAINMLNTFVGPLIREDPKVIPRYYTYRKSPDDYPIFDYDKRKNRNGVLLKDGRLVLFLQEYFQFTKDESIEVIKKWIEETYKLNIKEIDFLSGKKLTYK